MVNLLYALNVSAQCIHFDICLESGGCKGCQYNALTIKMAFTAIDKDILCPVLTEQLVFSLGPVLLLCQKGKRVLSYQVKVG